MSCDKYEAMQKFLETPVLLEKLLPYLDLGSTLTLAQTHQMTQQILQDSLAWNKLIQRNSPLDELEVVQNLVVILELMKEPKANMLDLLDAICTGPFPSEQWFSGSVRLGCPRHPDSPHLIPLERLEFLEQAEGAFDTTEQTVEAVKTFPFALDEPAMSVLGDRLACQEAKMDTISAMAIYIRTRRSAESFKTIMGASEEASAVHDLAVRGGIGAEGWTALAKGMQSHPGVVMGFSSSKEVMAEAGREDLRDIWEALSQDARWMVEDVYPAEMLHKPDGEAGWQKLEQIMDMSKDDLAAYVQMKMNDPNAWWKNTAVEGEADEVEIVEGEGDEADEGDEVDEEGDEEEVDVVGPQDDAEGA